MFSNPDFRSENRSPVRWQKAEPRHGPVTCTIHTWLPLLPLDAIGLNETPRFSTDESCAAQSLFFDEVFNNLMSRLYGPFLATTDAVRILSMTFCPDAVMSCCSQESESNLHKLHSLYSISA